MDKVSAYYLLNTVPVKGKGLHHRNQATTTKMTKTFSK